MRTSWMVIPIMAVLPPFLWLAYSHVTPEDLPRVEAEVREEFPRVERVSVEELEGMLETGETPLLLDVRAPEEFAVSHLPGAVRAETVAEARAAMEGEPGRPVIVYCSVGYRSAKLADELRQAGYPQVRNLEGSIFAWANAGHPVYRDGDEVHKVHPFNRRWGRLLREDLRADE